MQNSGDKKIIDVDPEENGKGENEQSVVKVEARPHISSDSSDKKPTISIGTLNIFNAPLQGLREPLTRRYYRHYEERHPHGKKHLLVDLLMLGTVIGLLGFNFFLYLGFGQGRLLPGIALTMEVAPETVRIGDMITVTTRYQNDNDASLTNVVFSFQLPEHFLVDTDASSRFDPKTKTLSLGALAPGANGEARIAGQLFGNRGEDAIFSTRFSYGEDRRRQEQKLAHVSIPLSDAVLSGSFAMPKRIINNVPFSFTLTLENSGRAESLPIVVEPVWPAGFALEKTEPALQNNRLQFDALPSGGRREIRASGVLSGSGEAETVFAMKSFFQDAGELLTLAPFEARVPVFYPKLSVLPTVDPAIVILGEPMTLTLSIENGEDVAVVDTTVKVFLPPLLFDVLATTTQGVKEEDGIVLSAVNTKELAYIRSKEKHDVTMILIPRGAIDPLLVFGDDERVIRLVTETTYRLESDLQDVIQTTSDPFVLPLHSDFGLNAFARYYSAEGDQLGRGPLPPVVGSTTKYWLFVHLNNTIHELENAVMTFVLPNNVEWTKKASVTFGDAVRYNASTRTMVWQLATVPAVTGSFAPDMGALVELALTPDESDVGAAPFLATDIRGEAKDKSTGSVIKRAAPDVRTDLPLDRRGRGKGKVVVPD